MAVTQEDRRYAVKVEYKPSFDTTNSLTLSAYSQNFNKIKETATNEQMKAFADALMSITKYADAPYKVTFIDTTQLVSE